MTGGAVVKGLGLGVILWFFGALYFGVLVEALVPTRATYLRTLANAAFLPMALISALVLVRQGQGAVLARATVALAAGGVLWFVVAAGVGALAVELQPELATEAFLRALNAVLLVLTFGAAWWATGRFGPGQAG